MDKILNYINGEHKTPLSEHWIDNYDPSIGKIYSLIPDSDEKDVELAYQAADKAFPIWSNTSKEERSKIMLKIVLKIKEKAKELAIAESVDNGKPVSLAEHVDIPRASSNMEFFATGILTLCVRKPPAKRCSHQLYHKKTNWGGWVYLPLEFTIVFIYGKIAQH